MIGSPVRPSIRDISLTLTLQMVAPAILFFCMMSLPESPRWHLLQARRLERRERPDRLRIERHYQYAFNALCKLRRTKLQAGRDLFLIDAWLTKEYSQTLWYDSRPENTNKRFSRAMREAWMRHKALFLVPRCRRAMTAGLIVMTLQQLCGVNVFAYYSSPVFKDSLPSGLSQDDMNELALKVRRAAENTYKQAHLPPVLFRLRCHQFWSCDSCSLPYRQSWPAAFAAHDFSTNGDVPISSRTRLHS